MRPLQRYLQDARVTGEYLLARVSLLNKPQERDLFSLIYHLKENETKGGNTSLSIISRFYWLRLSHNLLFNKFTDKETAMRMLHV